MENTSSCFLHKWKYITDNDHRICEGCGECQVNGANGWVKCSFHFLHEDIQRKKREVTVLKKQVEREQDDRKRALTFLQTLNGRICPKCKVSNISEADYCQNCGTKLKEGNGIF